MDLAWLLRGVSPKPESHARERDVEEAAEGEGQQRCSTSQVEARRAGPFHQPPWLFCRSNCPSQRASHLRRDLVGWPARGFARRPQVTGRGEEAGKFHSCLKGSASVWLADQDKGRGC